MSLATFEGADEMQINFVPAEMYKWPNPSVI